MECELFYDGFPCRSLRVEKLGQPKYQHINDFCILLMKLSVDALSKFFIDESDVFNVFELIVHIDCFNHIRMLPRLKLLLSVARKKFAGVRMFIDELPNLNTLLINLEINGCVPNGCYLGQLENFSMVQKIFGLGDKNEKGEYIINV